MSWIHCDVLCIFCMFGQSFHFFHKKMTQRSKRDIFNNNYFAIRPVGTAMLWWLSHPWISGFVLLFCTVTLCTILNLTTNCTWRHSWVFTYLKQLLPVWHLHRPLVFLDFCNLVLNTLINNKSSENISCFFQHSPFNKRKYLYICYWMDIRFKWRGLTYQVKLTALSLFLKELNR